GSTSTTSKYSPTGPGASRFSLPFFASQGTSTVAVLMNAVSSVVLAPGSVAKMRNRRLAGGAGKICRHAAALLIASAAGVAPAAAGSVRGEGDGEATELT